MEQKEKNQTFKEGRFEVTLYVNGNIVCRRNFSVDNYIEHSFETAEFKYAMDDMVKMVDNDLKSKSRVSMWYFFNPDDPTFTEDLVSPLIEPWECTFKLEVSDRKRPVMSRIWDGRFYPKYVREKVDINNKYVKTVSKDGEVNLFEKDAFFDKNKDRLSFDHYVLRSMIKDKSDVAAQMISKIVETCSVNSETHETIDDYTVTESWGKDANGNEVTYGYNIRAYNRRLEREWEKYLAKKKKN